MKPTNPQDCCNEIVDLLQGYANHIIRANKPDDYPIETRTNHATNADIERLNEHRKRHYGDATNSEETGGLLAYKSHIYGRTTELIKATPEQFRTRADEICRDLKGIIEYGFFMLYPLKPSRPTLPLNDTVLGEWLDRIGGIIQTILEFRDNYLTPDVEKSGQSEGQPSIEGYRPADTLAFKHGIAKQRLSEAASQGRVRTMVAPRGTLTTEGKSVRTLYNAADAVKHCKPKQKKRRNKRSTR